MHKIRTNQTGTNLLKMLNASAIYHEEESFLRKHSMLTCTHDKPINPPKYVQM